MPWDIVEHTLQTNGYGVIGWEPWEPAHLNHLIYVANVLSCL